eukprot:IDg5788t1
MPAATRMPVAHSLHVSDAYIAPTARENDAVTARIFQGELKHPYAQGKLRYTVRGVYTSGTRKNQLCIIKWPKTHHSTSIDPFKNDLKVAKAALFYINQWNAAGFTNQLVRLNMPVVWRLAAGTGHPIGMRVLVEPFIPNFRKWNSNTGWADTSAPWGRVMQALSHHSYHVSGGRSLVCDLEGGLYGDHTVVTDPVVCSTSRSYGQTDMGAEGISNFFARHKCNEYCHPSWKKPRHPRVYFVSDISTYIL